MMTENWLKNTRSFWKMRLLRGYQSYIPLASSISCFSFVCQKEQSLTYHCIRCEFDFSRDFFSFCIWLSCVFSAQEILLRTMHTMEWLRLMYTLLIFLNLLKICPVFPDKPIFTMPTKKRTQKPNHLKEPILYDHFGNPLDQVDPTPPNSRLTILTTILTILTSISILTSTINPPPWPPGSEKGQGTGGEEEIRGCRGRHLGQGGRGGAPLQEVACPPLQRLSQDQLSKHKSAACWG